MALQYAQPAQDAVQLLPERPLDGEELKRLDGRRLEPIIASLCSQLERYLSQNLRHQRQTGYTDATAEPQSLMVGLFGSFGQGKSTVLNEIRRRLREKQVVPWQFADRRTPRIVTLDVSHLKPEGIENFFWTLLLRHSLSFWTLVVAVIWCPVLLSVIYPDSAVSQWLSDKVFGLPAMLALLLPALEGVVKGIGQWVNIDPTLIDRTVYRFGKWFSFWPDVLLIDDLDRARVDQQRSLLWAMYRRAHRMQCAVVVAFDESELLASEPAPESPEELLRKLLLVTYRLPLRTAEDAAGFALGLCREWADSHRGHPLAQVVPEVTSVAALTQLAVRLGQISPRRIKSLLQDTLLQAQTLHHRGDTTIGASAVACVSVDTWVALLYLTALRQEVPVRCRDTVELAAVLERPTLEAITAWLKPMGDKHSKCELLRRLLPASALFAAERHSWRALAAGLLTDESTSTTADPPEPLRILDGQNLSRDDLDLLGRWWRELDSVACEHGHDESTWPNRLLKGSLEEKSPAQRAQALRLGWLAVWAYWPTAVRPAARLRVAEWWKQQVLTVFTQRETDALQRQWRRDLWRLLLTDSEVLALVPDTALREWVKQADDDAALWVFVSTLAAAPKNAHTVYWLAVVQADLQEQGRVRRALDGRLPSKLPAAAAEMAQGTNANAKFHVLRGTWPLVVADRKGAALRHHVATTVAQYAGYVPADKRVPLMSLRAFMDSARADEIPATEWLTLLAPLVRPESGEGWAPDCWHQGELPRPLRAFSEWTKAESEFITALDQGQWVAGLALLLTVSMQPLPPDWHHALVVMWQVGEKKGWRLGSEWLGDRKLLEVLALRVKENLDPAHLQAWLACQWLSQPDEAEFERLEIRNRLRQWVVAGTAHNPTGPLPVEFWHAWPQAMRWLFEGSGADALDWLPVPPGDSVWPESAWDAWTTLLLQLKDQVRGRRQIKRAIECGEAVLRASPVGAEPVLCTQLGVALDQWRQRFDGSGNGSGGDEDEFR